MNCSCLLKNKRKHSIGPYIESIETLEKSLGLIIWVFEEEEEEDFEGKEVREEEKHKYSYLFFHLLSNWI